MFASSRAKMVGRRGLAPGLVAACLWCFSPSAAHADAIRLVEAGRGLATIVIPDDTRPVALWRRDWTCLDAAGFLQTNIAMATGAVLPIRRESEAPPPPHILIGATRAGRAALGSDRPLRPEGFCIAAVSNGVAIVGETAPNGVDRGVLFGIYRFLDAFLGIRRYFAPDEIGAVIPRRNDLAVPAGTRMIDHPAYALRVGGIGHWDPETTRLWHPALRFGSSQGVVANHTFEDWSEHYGRDHPEYFGLRKDGTRAVTSERARSGQSRAFVCLSEPGVLTQLLANADAALAADTNLAHIVFGMSDVRDLCLCPACQPKIREDLGAHGRGSRLVFDFVARYADALRARHPRLMLWALAYDTYMLPPEEIRRLPDNVGITLCLLPPVTMMQDPVILTRNERVIDGWHARLGHDRNRLVLWDYFCYPSVRTPVEAPHVLRDFIRSTAKRSIGMMNNGFNPKTRAGAPELHQTYRMVWLYHQLLWNPDLDLEAACRQWCADLFGAAAPEMERFYKLLEAAWEDACWSESPRKAFLSPYSLYDETYPPAVIEAIEGLLAEARSKLEPGTPDRRRLDWFIDEGFAPFIARAREHHQDREANPMPRHPVLPIRGRPWRWGRVNERAWRDIPRLITRTQPDLRPASDGPSFRFACDTNRLYVAIDFPASNSRAVDGNDHFAIHFFTQEPRGYAELAVDARGNCSSGEALAAARGLTFTRSPVSWNVEAVERVARRWFPRGQVGLAIPWEALPGGRSAPPSSLLVQGFYLPADPARPVTSWTPILPGRKHPLAGYGRLVPQPHVSANW